jgi:hypothetical protein
LNTFFEKKYNMSRTTYVFEVVRVIHDKDGPNGWIQKRGKHEHVGYMDARFKTLKDACSYYNKHNPHMRPLDAMGKVHGCYRSDWDAATNLCYITRADVGVNCTIPPFDLADASVVNITDSSLQISYKWLK